MRRSLLILLIAVAGCGSVTPTSPAAAPLDPFALVGTWRVDGTPGGGDLVLIDPARIAVRTPTGTSFGEWRADASGRFLAGFSGYTPAEGGGVESTAVPLVPSPATPRAPGPAAAIPDPPAPGVGGLDAPTAVPPAPVVPQPPLATAVAFAMDGAARVLSGPDGAVLARLVPATASADDRTQTGVDPARAPTAQERAALAPPAALPSSLRAGDITGRWVPAGFTGPTKPGVEFRADGTYAASDGCNRTGGRWLAGPDGALLVTASPMTLIGCPGVPVPTQLGEARRAALDGGSLVLLKADGTESGRFTKS